MNDLSARILVNVTYRLGSKEDPPGSNRGPLPDKCYRFVHDGADPAKATVAEREWCAALYCLACHDAGMVNGPKTASTGGLYDWCAEHGQVISVPRDCRRGHIRKGGDASKAIPGDAGLVIDDTKDTGFCHTVCLVKDLGGGWWKCMAGNEGNEVAISRRKIETLVIVRPYR